MRSQPGPDKIVHGSPASAVNPWDWWILAGLTLLLIVGMSAWEMLGFEFPRCRFREVLHVACPTCGSGRSLLALGRFDLSAAVRYNPLLVLIIAGLFAAPFVAGSRRLPEHFRVCRARKRCVAIILFLVLANWAYLLFTL